MSITYQQHESHARAVRQGHDGRTSRGLSVEIARFALDNPIFGDDPAELLADLQRCAADCIAAGCEPCFPLPGQDGQGSSLAAPVEADQVETPTQKAKPARAASGKRSAEAARAGFAIVFGVQGHAGTPAFPVPVGNTGTENNGVVHA